MALRLLGPVVLLAAVAAFALVRDGRNAEREAATRVREVAGVLTERLAGRLEAQQNPPPTGAAPAGPRVVARFRIGVSNVLLEPRVVPWPPSPQALDPLPSAEPQRRWQEARAAFDRQDWAAAIQGYDRLLEAASDLSSRPRLLGRWERALSLERAGQTNGLVDEFQKVFGGIDGDSMGPVTEAGVPLLHLAGMRILDAAEGDPGRLPEAWRIAPERVLTALARETSPFSAACLDRLRPMLRLLASGRGGAASATLEQAETALLQARRARECHAEATRVRAGMSGDWPDLFWVGNGPSAWLAVGADHGSANPAASARPGRAYAAMPEPGLVEELDGGLRALDRAGDFRAVLDVAGRRLSPGGVVSAIPAVDPEARRWAAVPLRLGAGEATVRVALADPSAFFAARRARLVLFAALLVAVLGVATASVVTTYRGWLKHWELNRQQLNFVASVSHELRAPLGSIRLLAEGLERGSVQEAERRQEYFRLIGQETRRLGALVDNVLDLSRIGQGRKRYELEPVDGLALVRGTLKVFQPLADERGVRLETMLPAEPGSSEIVADGRALQQALLNLLDNALKHSPAGTAIRVTWERREDAPGRGAVRLSVADAGPGIPVEDHVRIFEPFYRRGSELRRETQGVGIGLSIVVHIAEAHGGRVEVRSTPGAGAEFTLVLPFSCAS